MYSFDDIYGNELIKKSLKTAVKQRKISQAYIFSGDTGSGKTTFAKTFAKTLQCESGGINPCLKCISCKIFDSYNHPDVIYVTPSKTKALGVDDIREQVNRQSMVKPFKYPYKIFIIENGDTMTPAAQNALLKTIEEPADYGVFLFTAKNLEKFLPTILSRSVIYKIKPLTDAQVCDYLISKAGFSLDEAGASAVYARGSIGRGLTLKDNENFRELRKMALNLAVNKSKGFAAAFSQAKEIEGFKDQIKELLDILYVWYRDIIVYKACRDDSFIIEREKLRIIKEEAANITLAGLFRKEEAIWQAMVELSQNANFSMAMDVLMMTLKEN